MKWYVKTFLPLLMIIPQHSWLHCSTWLSLLGSSFFSLSSMHRLTLLPCPCGRESARFMFAPVIELLLMCVYVLEGERTVLELEGRSSPCKISHNALQPSRAAAAAMVATAGWFPWEKSISWVMGGTALEGDKHRKSSDPFLCTSSPSRGGDGTGLGQRGGGEREQRTPGSR